MADSLRERLEKTNARLRNERDSNWLSEWRDLGDFMSPRSGRWSSTDTNNGRRRDQKIINPQATFAARTLGAGMHTGMTNPASPWVKFGPPDPGMAEFAPVKAWLYSVEKAMREVMARSNLYSVLPNRYSEEGVFGTAPMVVLPDEQDLIRAYPLAVGSYPQSNTSDDIVFERDLNLARGVTVQVISYKDGKTYKATYPTNSARGIAPGQSTSRRQVYEIKRNGLDQNQAQQLAQKIHREITVHEMRMSCSMPGDNSLMPNTIVRQEGTGSGFDQLYYVDSVRRSLSFESGYTMNLTAKNHNPNSMVQP